MSEGVKWSYRELVIAVANSKLFFGPLKVINDYIHQIKYKSPLVFNMRDI